MFYRQNDQIFTINLLVICYVTDNENKGDNVKLVPIHNNMYDYLKKNK